MDLLSRQLLTLARRVESHQLRVAALHGAVDVRALNVDLAWVVLLREELVRLSVPLATVAPEKVPLAHTFRCEHTHSDSELVECTLLDGSPRAVPHQLESEDESFVRLFDIGIGC